MLEILIHCQNRKQLESRSQKSMWRIGVNKSDCEQGYVNSACFQLTSGRFKTAEKHYGKIDHVFANAGVEPTFTLLEDDVDANGELLPPNLKTINVNFLGCLYTVKLGIHHTRKNPAGGSIVITASASSVSRFPTTEYSKPFLIPRV